MNENATPPTDLVASPADSAENPVLGEVIELASLKRRMVSMVYEVLLLAALLLVAGFAYVPIFGAIHGPFQKAVFQLYLLAVICGYFVLFWRRGGQTLAMKTWRIRLVAAEGGGLSVLRCLQRFALAFAGLLCLGLGFLWALVDRDRQFLHDRLTGTRLVITA